MGMGGGPVGRGKMPSEFERGVKAKGKKTAAKGKKKMPAKPPWMK